MSEEYTPDNLLDRMSDPATLDVHYGRLREREQELLGTRLDLARGGDALAVGCGRDPGRHLFPAPAWRMTGVELEEEWPRMLVESGELDAGLAGRAGELDELEDGSFDVVLYRYVLH
ncbi:MAG: class I SAM-dependent methyltransferase, partial [Actinomycetota bacterium]|nr:class I SAM-dependent methyltransferase [Actinomycetota bacterium]